MLTGRVLGYRCFQVLSYVSETIAAEGIAPSYDMICDALGISNRSKVADIVKRLERRGLLSRVGTGRCPRGVSSREVRRIALIGR
jgi:SOS-response transcriptional repressor LexA